MTDRGTLGQWSQDLELMPPVEAVDPDAGAPAEELLDALLAMQRAAAAPAAGTSADPACTHMPPGD